MSTYDVGGNQAMQQSALRVHGARDDDKNFAIDGTVVNWPGGGGGSTMLYYDQGMFEEVNYQTSAIPAEVMTGGIFMNMVTKSGQPVAGRPEVLLLRHRPLAEQQRRRGAGRRAGWWSAGHQALRSQRRRRRADPPRPPVGEYLRPSDILSPRIVRAGITLDF